MNFRSTPDCPGYWFYRAHDEQPGVFHLIIIDSLPVESAGLYFGPVMADLADLARQDGNN